MSYEKYMNCSPMTDGKEMRNFFDDDEAIEVGSKVKVNGYSMFEAWGRPGTVVRLLTNYEKAEVDFHDGCIAVIQTKDLRLV